VPSSLNLGAQNSKAVFFGNPEDPDVLSDDPAINPSTRANSGTPAPIVIPDIPGASTITTHLTPPPIAGVSQAVSVLSMNEEVASSVVLTPKFVFYATPGGIFAVDKSKRQALASLGVGTCNGAATAEGEDCALVSGEAKNVHSMVWDGDGNIYV